MGRRDILFLGLVCGALAAFASALAPGRPTPNVPTVEAPGRDDLRTSADRVDAALRAGRPPGPIATHAPELARIRRLSLALVGTIPSLEEIRRFEAAGTRHRVETYLGTLLADRRSGSYLAERLARAFVGVEDGPSIVFRRRRFVAWLGDQLLANRPYDALVRDLIAGDGVWTDHPATNFVTAAYDPARERPDAERLAARAARAFLGARIDCAQCHDHPFQPWKQADFRGLAAFFGQARSGLGGVRDDPAATLAIADPRHGGPVEVAPRLPFLPELDPGSGSRRDRLAGWITDRRNPRFARAAANRAWAILFGRALVEPIDDLGADLSALPPALEALADDFAAHGHDFRRLIQVIAATEAFALDSTAPAGSGPTPPEADWSSFPITRLRPEQVASAVQQAASTATIDLGSHVLVRLAAAGGVVDFVRRHGDLGESEFAPEPASTIPQRLLMMNGDLVSKSIGDELGNATARIALLAPDDRKAVEAIYLATLTRRPTPDESRHFERRLVGTVGDERKGRMGDIAWTLLNATEFSWNH